MTTILGFLEHVLACEGPVTFETLVQRLRHENLSKARDLAAVVRNALTAMPTAISLPDRRWTSPHRFLDGVVATHVVRSPTKNRADLWPRYDLAAFGPILARGAPLATGGQLRATRYSWQQPEIPAVLVGPPGWLPPAQADTTLVFRWHHGLIDVSTTMLDPHSDTLSSRENMLRTLFLEHRSIRSVSHMRYPIASALWGAMLEAPDIMRAPVSPLTELLAGVIDSQAADTHRRCCRCAAC